MKVASEEKVEYITFDGAGGGTGMSPVPMMNEMSMPTVYLRSADIGARGKIRAVYTYLSEQLGLGLKQLLAGARKFKLDLIDRSDIASMNKLASEVTGIPMLHERKTELFEEILTSQKETSLQSCDEKVKKRERSQQPFLFHTQMPLL
jgi:hypothetical protein